MTDANIELTRRRILGGVATIGAASAAVGAGTFAAFTDTADSTDNQIRAGTLALGDATSTGFGVTNLAPGESVSATVTATYEGPLAAAISVDDVALADADG